MKLQGACATGQAWRCTVGRAVERLAAARRARPAHTREERSDGTECDRRPLSILLSFPLLPEYLRDAPEGLAACGVWRIRVAS